MKSKDDITELIDKVCLYRSSVVIHKMRLLFRNFPLERSIDRDSLFIFFDLTTRKKGIVYNITQDAYISGVAVKGKYKVINAYEDERHGYITGFLVLDHINNKLLIDKMIKLHNKYRSLISKYIEDE